MEAGKKATLLYLDGSSHLPLVRLSLARCGIVDFDMYQQKDIGDPNVYESPEHVCQQITLMTSNNKVDIVIIGNNLGAGVAKARAVADAMRDRTVVVWNVYRKGDESTYAKLGFKRFGSRSDLPDILSAMLGASTEQ